MWAREVGLADEERTIALLYLANEILQQSKAQKKGNEFLKEFGNTLPAVSQGVQGAPRDKLLRLVGIWEERKIFGASGGARVIGKIRAALGAKGGESPTSGKSEGTERTHPEAAAPPSPGGPAAPAELGPLAGALAAAAKQKRLMEETAERCKPAFSISLTVSGSPEDVAEKQGMLDEYAAELGRHEHAQRAAIQEVQALLKQQEAKLSEIGQLQRRCAGQSSALQARLDSMLNPPAEPAGRPFEPGFDPGAPGYPPALGQDLGGPPPMPAVPMATAPAPRAPPTVDGVLHKLGTSADATQKLAAALKGLGPEALAKLRAARAAAQK